MRDWPDDEGWRKQMAAAGYSAADMERLSKLPPGVKKGDLAGIVTMGETVPNATVRAAAPPPAPRCGHAVNPLHLS